MTGTKRPVPARKCPCRNWSLREVQGVLENDLQLNIQNKHPKSCTIDRLCGQNSWLQIQRPGFDSRHYQIWWEVVGLERGPLSLVNTIEELLGRKNSGSSLENREYGCRHLPCWPRDTLYPQKLVLTSPTSAASAFTASIASEYRLSTSRITLSELNNDLPGLDRLLKYNRKRWGNCGRKPGIKDVKQQSIGSRNQLDAWPEKRHLNGG
jgi:hypothetical protein